MSRRGAMRRRGRLAPPSATGALVGFVAAATCFLGVLALAASLAAGRIAEAWGGALGAEATIRIPASAGPEAVGAVLAALSTAGVEGARALDAAETAALVAPWLGPGADPAALPLPALIAVPIGAEGAEAGGLRAALEAAAPQAVFDDHAALAARLERAAGAFRGLAGAAAGLAFATLAAMIVVAARASLAGAAGMARTLSLLGARDGRIAAVFDGPMALRALLGGAAGAGAAAMALAAAPGPGVAAALGLSAAPAYGPALWAALGAPLAAGAIAWLTARLTVLAMLRRAS